MRAARGFFLLPLILVLAAMPPAVAVEKCVSPQGKVTYSEQPCPAGSKGQTIGGGTAADATKDSAPADSAGSGGSAKEGAAEASKAPATRADAAGVAPSGVTLRYFEVQGNDFDTLLAALNANGGFHGKAEWKLSYRYQPKRAGRVCSLQSVSTQLDLSMTLPRWTPPPGASANLHGRWTRYVSALRVHEEGHLQIGRDFDTSLKKSLAVIRARCDQLDGRLKEIFATLLAQHQKRDIDYDRDTAQGRTQGAEFK